MKSVIRGISNHLVGIIGTIGVLFIAVTLVVQGQATSDQIPAWKFTQLPTSSNLQVSQIPISIGRNDPELEVRRDISGHSFAVKANPNFRPQGNIREMFSVRSNFANGLTVPEYSVRPSVGICQGGSCTFTGIEGLKVIVDSEGNLSVYLPPSWHRVE